jgi:phage-related protein
MLRWLNKTIDKLSEFLAARKGLLPFFWDIPDCGKFYPAIFPGWMVERE